MFHYINKDQFVISVIVELFRNDSFFNDSLFIGISGFLKST